MKNLKKVVLSQPQPFEVSKMKKHPMLTKFDKEGWAKYVKLCAEFDYEGIVVNKDGVIYSHYDDFLAAKQNKETHLWVRVIESGIDETNEIQFLWRWAKIPTKGNYPVLAWFIGEFYKAYEATGYVGKVVELVADDMDISTSLVEKIRKYEKWCPQVLSKLGIPKEQDEDGITFLEADEIYESAMLKNGKKSANTDKPKVRIEKIKPNDLSLHIDINKRVSGKDRKFQIQFDGKTFDCEMVEKTNNQKSFLFKFIDEDKRVITVQVPLYKVKTTSLTKVA